MVEPLDAIPIRLGQVDHVEHGIEAVLVRQRQHGVAHERVAWVEPERVANDLAQRQQAIVGNITEYPLVDLDLVAVTRADQEPVVEHVVAAHDAEQCDSLPGIEQAGLGLASVILLAPADLLLRRLVGIFGRLDLWPIAFSASDDHQLRL